MLTKITGKSYWILTIATISAVPFLLFAGYSIVQLVQSKQQDLQQQMVDRAHTTANAVAERLSISTGTLRALASSDAAALGDVAAMYAQAKRVLPDLPGISAISLVTRDGQVQFLTLLPLGAKSFPAGDLDAIRRVFESGKPVVSEPFRSPIDNDITVTSIGVPVFRDGKVVYCLRAIFRNTSLNNLLNAQHLPTDWISGILSQTGLVEARSQASEKFVAKPAASSVLKALLSHRTGVFDATTQEGSRNKAVIVGVPGWDWHVIVGVPANQFYEPVNRAILFLCLFGLATLVLGAMFIGWVSYYRRNRTHPVPSNRTMLAAKVANIWPSAVALALAVAIGTVSTLSAQDALQQIRDLTDRRQMIRLQGREVSELLSAYKDIETAQRGFVITGEESYLTPYLDALPKIELITNSLKSEVVRTGLTNFNWSDLTYFSSLRLTSAAEGIAMRRKNGPEAIRNRDFFDNGNLLTQKLRLLLGSLDADLDAEAQRINESIAAQEIKTRQLQWLSQMAIGALVMLSVGIWLHERQRRQKLLEQLRLTNETLEDRVAARTQELSDVGQRIKNFALETEALIDHERKRLSREVHDQIGQIFTGLKMIARTLKPGSLDDDQYQAMMGAIESGVKISRRIAAELRPPLLDDFGIRAALEHYLKSTFVPLEIAFDLTFPDKCRLSPQQKNQLFRMIQEACTNIIRHASAKQVDVHGRIVMGGFEVSVEDDGIGFDTSRIRADALGLTGIEERAKLSGAQFTVKPRAGGGTRIAILFSEDALLAEVAA